LAGEEGDKILISGNTADLLFGGEDEDVIVGAGGDDNIYGDASLTSATRDWTTMRQTNVAAHGSTSYGIDIANATPFGNIAIGAADVIYAGTGDDWIFAGAGDDYVDGGAGDDVILGEGGSDVLLGG